MPLISIDPGKTQLGWALFETDILQACGLVRGKDATEMLASMRAVFVDMHPSKIIVEVPQIYQQRMWKGDPNDLVDVAVVAGMVTSVFDNPSKIDLIRPRKWKGSRPKKICNVLTLNTLSTTEISVLRSIDCPASLRHNVIDAIGIGLWRLGRR